MIQHEHALGQSPLAKSGHRYHAFISYAHEDTKTVEWLCRLLSVFWVPWKRRRRIFMDQDSLPAGGGLSATLKDALKDSRFLIVCCSKDSVDSAWVNLEVTEFLESHPAANVLACLVGARTVGPFAVPQAVQRVQEAIGDDLFKPDLRGNPEGLKRREQKAATKEALALLAPLVNLPGKDELLDLRKKTLIIGTVLLTVLICAAVGWKIWDDRPASQINKILSQSPALVNAISTGLTSSKSTPPQAKAIADDTQDARHSVVDEWLRTLVLTGRSNDALDAVRKIDRSDARFHAAIEVTDQLTQGRGIRHYVDHWGQPSWETVRDRPDGQSTGATDAATVAAKEAVQAANRVVEAVRTIEDAGARSDLMVKVVNALAKIGNRVEATRFAHEALEAGRKIADPSTRSSALVRVVAALANAGDTDEAAPIAAEAIEAAQMITDAENRSVARVRVAEALAGAGKWDEARETVRPIEEPSWRSYATARMVEALIGAGRYGEARAAARRIEKPDDRAKALVGIVEALVKAGKNDEATQTANEALKATGQLEFDIQARSTANSWVMEMLAGMGRTEEALEMARRTRSAADRSRSLGWLVGAQVKAGRHAEAARVAGEAVEAARRITDPNARTGALLDIGEALANSDRSTEVGRIANEALATIGPRGSYWRMDTIVRLLVKGGNHVEASQVAQRELAARQQLPPGKARTEGLANYAIPLFLSSTARSATSAETRQVAHAVLEAAQQKKYEWEARRVVFLVEIVGALAQAGKSDEAVEAAELITNQIYRVQALVRIAEELGRARDAGKARRVINQARQLAQQLTIVKDQSFALAEVAKGLANLHDFRLARETVESQSSSSDRLAAYIVIMREYAIERDPSLAKLFEEKKAD